MRVDPTITKSNFIFLLIACLVSATIKIVIDSNDITLDWLNTVLDKEPQLWELIILGFLGIYACVICISFIGLFFFKNWARKIYIYTFFPNFFILILPPYISWTYMSGLSNAFYDLNTVFLTLVWGILVIPSLYQPIFNKELNKN